MDRPPESPPRPREDAVRRGVRLLLCFADDDRPYAWALEQSLTALRGEGLVESWIERVYHRDEITEGTMPPADVIVPLVSASMLAYSYDNVQEKDELEKIGKLGTSGAALVVPVIVSPCDWYGSELAQFVALPRSGRPVSSWPHLEDAWTDVVNGLRDALTTKERDQSRRAQWSGRVIRMTASWFTVFGDVTLRTSPGINVFIGLNGTGKSHALKLMYAVLRAPLEHGKGRFLEKLDAVFKVEGPFGLASRFRSSGARTAIGVVCETGEAQLQLLSAGEEPAAAAEKLDFSGSRALFIPSREALSMYEGFTSAYERRELSFDETYYDLCKELSAVPLRERAIGPMLPVLEMLEDALGGTVKLGGTRFYVRSAIGDVPAHLVAEGMRKIASLAYLVRDGALNEQTILFWDEPEANLNPKLVTVIARVLRHLASLGVQIFLATHDYLLVRELSLAAEYRTEPRADLRFFSFYRDREDEPVRVEPAETFAALEHNPILDEFRAHYEREQALFYAPEDAPKGTPEEAA